MLAQLARRIAAALRHRRIFVVRHRAEDRAIRRFGGRERGFRQGRAMRAKRGKPDRHRREGKTKLESSVDRAKDVHRRGGDLRPDAVALHDDNTHRRRRIMRCHRLSLPGRAAS
jgi:hypothetical protein